MHKLNIIVEGVDRVGKDTQIALLKRSLYPKYVFQTLHYSKVPFDNDIMNIEYSEKLYNDMFRLMSNSDINFIVNRSHIGEMVYGPLYRNYSGEYVLELERAYMNDKKLWDNIVLITMVNSPENIKDREDGNSLSNSDIKKMKIEKGLFMKAHDKSYIENKLIIDCKDYSIEHIHGQIMNFIDKVLLKK